MLSNVEMILLSLVKEKPSYGYEIDKQIQARDMRCWARIGVASIYQVLERLANKGFLYSEREQEGKMPPRNRYFLTPTGLEALREAAGSRLAKLEWFYLDLNLGLEAGNCLNEEELAACLRIRRNQAYRNLRGLSRMLKAGPQGGYNKKMAVATLLLGLRRTEISFLDDTLAALEKEKAL